MTDPSPPAPLVSLQASYQHYYAHIAQISLSKLHNGQHARTEPLLRRQVLIRNILLSAWPQPAQYSLCQSQQEEEWLDACFDQLDDDDDEDEDDPVAVEKPDQDVASANNSHRWMIALPLAYAQPDSPPLRASQGESQQKPQQPITLVEWSW